ncbi:MAG TPA: DNA primase [Geminicoccaceae bacterium]|nr:DNA primase [Geminicoccaceae bacterium]
MAAEPRGPSLEEFKARLPVADVVGRHVRLTRRGRQLKGLCPFHKEKTPSFYVYEDDGHYHCFGCGAHGTAIDFVMAVEGLGFADALQRLAELTGLPAPAARAGGGGDGPAARERDDGLYRANEAAARWFAGRLRAAGAGAEARAYLERRGVAPATVERFGLGYAPEGRDGLKRALVAEGYGEDLLAEAGLLVRPEDGDGDSFDRFRHRLMFPIHDRRGRVVGFGGRALGEARAKYQNTSETPLFQKGHLLYGLALARQAARERGTVILAEGYMDVIALAQAGFANAVAPLGTAVTEEQLEQLWRLADEPVVCLDGDAAGFAAAGRLADRALPRLRPGRSLRFVILPEGEDPDSLIRRHGGDALADLLQRAVPLSGLLWRRETRDQPLDTPERRAGLRQRLRALARTAGHDDLRRELDREFRRLFDERVGRPPEPGRRGARSPRSLIPQTLTGVGPARLAHGVRSPAQRSEARLLGFIVGHPELLVEVEEELAALELSDPHLDGMRQEILAWYAHSGHLDPTSLRDHLTRHGLGDLADGGSSGGFRAALPPSEDARALEGINGWRRMIAEYEQHASERSEKQANEQAIRGARDPEEITKRRLALNSIMNVHHVASGHPRDELDD